MIAKLNEASLAHQRAVDERKRGQQQLAMQKAEAHNAQSEYSRLVKERDDAEGRHGLGKLSDKEMAKIQEAHDAMFDRIEHVDRKIANVERMMGELEAAEVAAFNAFCDARMAAVNPVLKRLEDGVRASFTAAMVDYQRYAKLLAYAMGGSVTGTRAVFGEWPEPGALPTIARNLDLVFGEFFLKQSAQQYSDAEALTILRELENA